MINEINELVGSKQFQEARNLIDEALKTNPDDRELLKLAGLTYVNLELWNDAKKHFESVVKFEAEDATSWFYLAKCYEKLGDFISSKNAYISVINLREEVLVDLRVSLSTFALGVVSEYFYINGLLDDYNVYKEKYLNALTECLKKGKVHLPKRRWF